ncbi:MAG TPA: hypothetical protein VE978_24560 [Chitinophagales bacterium]|nr:hypothetical protein [Chitinophagales bacterium]
MKQLTILFTLSFLFVYQMSFSQNWGGQGKFNVGFAMQYPSVTGSITYPFQDGSLPEDITITDPVSEGALTFGASFWYNQPIYRLTDNFSIGNTTDAIPSVGATGFAGSLSSFITIRFGNGDRDESESKFGAGLGFGVQLMGAYLEGENFSYPSTNQFGKYGSESGGFPTYIGAYARPAFIADIYFGRLKLKLNYQLGKYKDPLGNGEVPDENWTNVAVTIGFQFGNK